MINRGLGDWIHRLRVKRAGHTALISAAGKVTYDELSQRIDRLANALVDRGVRQGDRVAYLGENYPSFLEALFATTALGAVFVPINTRLAPPEVKFQLEDSGAKLLFLSTMLAPLGVLGSRGSDVEGIILVDDGQPKEPELTEEDPAIEKFEDVVSSGALGHPDVQVGIEDLALILYTSGTTGNPKGAMLSHENLTWNCINVVTDFDFASTDVSLMISPMFHVAALSQGCLPALMKGSTVILEPKFEPGRALELIEKYGVTNVSGVPTTYQLLVEHPAWDSTDLSTLKNLTCGGSAVPLRILEAYEARGVQFTMGYGMTETSPGATTLPRRFSREKLGSAGLEHFHTFVRVADPLGEVVPTGEVGEIQVQGPNVIKSYWNRPDANESSFIHAEDGTWLKTGDMGYFDEDGFLFISDRLKDMIISGGENIYPAQVELEIGQMEEVASVAVFGVEDDKWGEVPRAAVVVREGYEITEEQIVEYAKTRLAKYKVPKTIVFVDDMPRTASGKIRKPDLRKQHGA